MNLSDIMDAARQVGSVIVIQNLTINNADTIVNGDVTVNRVNVQAPRQKMLGGVEYRHSHCEPLADELHGNVWGWGDTSDKETDYYNRVYRFGQ